MIFRFKVQRPQFPPGMLEEMCKSLHESDPKWAVRVTWEMISADVARVMVEGPEPANLGAFVEQCRTHLEEFALRGGIRPVIVEPDID